MADVLKFCPRCRTYKSRCSFPRSSARRDGLHGYCRPCNNAASLAWQQANPDRNRELRRRSQMRVKYGIEHGEYDRLLASQGGGCAICGATKNRGKRLNIDHDHMTGEIRGLLCWDCNTAIGKMHDDPERLRAAADYLERRNG